MDISTTDVPVIPEGTIFALVNSRLNTPCIDQADAGFLAELAQVEAEAAMGAWIITDSGVSIGVSSSSALNRRVGCLIEAVTAPPVYRVLKDTIICRMGEAGLLGALLAVVNTLDAEDRFVFDQSSWFTSNNPQIVGGVVACGGDPAVILAFDPLA